MEFRITDPTILRRFAKRIYIPLPDKKSRKHMFKIHVGITPNSLTDQDFAIIAQKTDGFSGSDISATVQRALMGPVNSISLATHFVKQRDPQHKCPYIWLPCSPVTPGAIRMSLMDIPDIEQNYVRAGKVTLSHFLRALKDVQPSVAKRDIKRYHDWAATFGYVPSKYLGIHGGPYPLYQNEVPSAPIMQEANDKKSKCKKLMIMTWKNKKVNKWSCDETQNWIYSLNIICEDDKNKFIHGIQQSHLTGEDFFMCQNGEEISDSFDGISVEIGKKII
eukprot:445030_1